MKKSLTTLAIFMFFKLSAQVESRHFRYNFQTAAYIQLTMLPTETKVFETKAIWHTVRDRRFMLLFIEEVRTESDIEGGIEKENWNDTLLFDLENFKVYSALEKKCYVFNKRQFMLNREGKFVSHDTLIDCSERIPVLASPSPTLMINKGIGVYKTRRFTFQFLDETKSRINLSGYFDRYRHFKFSTGKAPFAY